MYLLLQAHVRVAEGTRVQWLLARMFPEKALALLCYTRLRGGWRTRGERGGRSGLSFSPSCRHVGTAMRLSHPPNPFINVGNMIATGCCGRRPPAAPARLHPPVARGACSAA